MFVIIQQFFAPGIAHSSYLVGGKKQCAVVDPQRDVDVYIKTARQMGLRITHVLETHLHADFISGHLELKERTGAQIYAPRSADCAFPHNALEEGDSFLIENMEFSVLETPGHTPEHLSYVVRDRSRGEEPVSLFCGDTLFVGDVGRPDLFPGRAEELGEALYHSLHEKILKLPDFCEVYPAHGAGSLCGRALGAKRSSTIGYERTCNGALQIKNCKNFVVSLTSNMPPAPDHFSRCSEINRRGPALIRSLPGPQALEPGDFERVLQEEDALVPDLRSYDAFGGQHIPKSWHIDIHGNFATFAGWVLPPDKEILLVEAPGHPAKDALVQLHRVGLDNVRGFLRGGLFAWAREGREAGHVPQRSAGELHRMIQREEPLAIVDVRSPGEFQKSHIEGALNIPVPDLRSRWKEVPRDVPLMMLCSTGHRGSLAASILLRHGIEAVENLAGGMTGYSAAGYVPACPMCVVPHGPRLLD